jgi:hypothetical protein
VAVRGRIGRRRPACPAAPAPSPLAHAFRLATQILITAPADNLVRELAPINAYPSLAYRKRFSPIWRREKPPARPHSQGRIRKDAYRGAAEFPRHVPSDDRKEQGARRLPFYAPASRELGGRCRCP